MSTDLLIISGPGIVARRGAAVLWAESTDLRREGLLASLVTRLADLPGGRMSPQQFADWMLGELAGPRGATVPALAFTVPDDGQVLVVVHGWGRVTAPGGTVTAQGAPHRIPAALPIAVGRADLAVLASGDSVLDLESGIVPGGAGLLLIRTSPGAPAAPVAPVAEPEEPAAPRHLAHAGSPSGPSLFARPEVDERPEPQPAPGRQPAPAPEPAPAWEPQAAVRLEPDSEPAPIPEPQPAMRPEQEPEPQPEPAPEPEPVRQPQAAPAPEPVAVHTQVPGPHGGTPPPGQDTTPPPGMGFGGVALVSLRPDLSEPTPPREPLPIAEPAPAAGPDGAPPAPQPPPAPAGPRAAIVPGVRCARQHFNNPSALYCRICGISMLQQTHVQVQGERPPLGVLVCDDGSTYGLDGDYAIGSDPRAEPGVTSGLAQPLVLGEAAAGVAPTHVIIHLDGWEVLALNRSPGLPAAVLHRGDTQWTPLPPGQWARLAAGSYVGFAGRHIVFESNNRA